MKKLIKQFCSDKSHTKLNYPIILGYEYIFVIIIEDPTLMFLRDLLSIIYIEGLKLSALIIIVYGLGKEK